MTITISLGSWMVPTILTLAAIASIPIYQRIERHDSGMMAGFKTFVALMIAIVTIPLMWIVYFAAILLK